VAETLIQVGRFVVIFLVARAIAELLVRLHLIVPPDTQAQLAGRVPAGPVCAAVPHGSGERA
jgi:hypothetical protein